MIEDIYTKTERLNNEVCRMWVNCPSSNSELNKYHGKNVLTIPKVIYGRNGKFIRVYFTEGTIISMNMPIAYLDKGWKSGE